MALVVLLRGVNVGGHRTFRPTVLADALEHLDIVNIGAAGTFVIRRAVSPVQVRAAFARHVPFQTEIMICQGHEILRLTSKHLLADRRARPDTVRFVSLLSKRPLTTPTIPMRLPEKGKWLLRILALDDRFIVGVYRREMKAIGYLGQLDRLFGVSATTRNWNTIIQIADVLRASNS